VLAQPAEPVLERRVGRVEEVAEDVNVAPLRLRVELGRRDDPNTEPLPRRDGVGYAGERVVVRERLDRHATRGGPLDERGRLERAVRAQRVRVQVDRVAEAHGYVRSTRSIERALPVASS